MKELLLDLYLAGGAVAVGLALTGLGLLVAWGVKKIKWASVRGLAETAWELLSAVTKEANAELLAKLNAAKDPASDGGEEITDEEWRAARKAAVAKFKELYGLENLAKLAKSLGLELDALDKYLESKVAGSLIGPL